MAQHHTDTVLLFSRHEPGLEPFVEMKVEVFDPTVVGYYSTNSMTMRSPRLMYLNQSLLESFDYWFFGVQSVMFRSFYLAQLTHVEQMIQRLKANAIKHITGNLADLVKQSQYIYICVG